MKTWILFKRLLVWLILAAQAGAAQAQSLQLVSTPNPGQPAPASGGGMSEGAILSSSGRYVLFASTANNLALTTNGAAMKAVFLPPMNVFLRDRTNGTTTLVSVDVTGLGGGSDNSLPLGISPDGHYALFESVATNLVANDTNNAQDIFLRDMVAGITTLISVNTNGVVASGQSRDAVMTPDGRYIAFTSEAGDLVAGDTNGIPDIFVRDVIGGTTVVASVGAAANQVITNGASSVYYGTSETPLITPDGRYVAFYSTATNLVAGAQIGAGDIYVRDLVAGTTVWASSGAYPLLQSVLGATNGYCFNHALSTNGQFVAYEASTRNVINGLILRYNVVTGTTDLVCTNASVQGGPTQDVQDLNLSSDGRFVVFVAATNVSQGMPNDVLLWDAQSGVSTLVSGDTNGLVPTNSVCDYPAVAPDGHLVLFASSATGLTTNTLTSDWHVYVRDLQAGTTTQVDADTNGFGSAVVLATVPTLSPDGSCVAFASADSDLVPNDINREDDLFVRTLATGAVELISAHDPALPTAAAVGDSTAGCASAVSANGRYIAFATDANNLTANDTNQYRDIVVRDMSTGSNTLVSVSTNGFNGDGFSTQPTISADGRYVAFTSSSDNLVAGDTNNSQDVFVRDLQLGVTSLVSVNTGGGVGNSNSYSPVLSTNGNYVLFQSQSINLAAGLYSGTAGTANLFLRNLKLGTTWALTTDGLVAAAMTPDGSLVAYTDTLGEQMGKLYIWSTASSTRVATNTVTSPISSLSISPDGSKVAYLAGSYPDQLCVWNRASNTTQVISASQNSTLSPVMRFSQNGSALVYNRNTNTEANIGTNQVYVYYFQAGTNVLVSHAFNSSQPGSAGSDSPVISADGRFIAYRSAATNLVAGATSGIPNLYLYDQQTGINTLLSASEVNPGTGNSRSWLPVFSADGHTLVFQSWSSDLVPQTFNQKGNVMAYMLLYVSIQAGTAQGQPPCLSWPASPNSSYYVQFKNTLQDPSWQTLSGTPTNSGANAYLADPTAGTGQRFYRVMSY